MTGEDQAAERQVHVEMPVKNQAAEHQVHVEMQVKIKQQSLAFM